MVVYNFIKSVFLAYGERKMQNREKEMQMASVSGLADGWCQWVLSSSATPREHNGHNQTQVCEPTLSHTHNPFLPVVVPGLAMRGWRSFSVESLLEARREDPEELLLALGFGGQEADPVARIPERFLVQPSQARGVDLRRLVCHQETLSQRHDTGIPGQWHWQLRDAHIHWLQQRALGTDPDWRTPPPRALETARARAGVVPSILVTSGSATHDWC